MGKQQKLKQQRREEREQVRNDLMNQSKEFDDIYNNNKVHTMIFDMNQKNKIKNTKPDYITFYNEDTKKVIKTFSINELIDKLTIKEDNIKTINENDIDEYSKYCPTELNRKVLISLTKYITDKLHNNKIEYFIDGGSLLGAVRHKNIIPHDDDVDIGMFEDGFNKLINLLDDIDGDCIYIDDTCFDIFVEHKNQILKFYCRCDPLNKFNNLIGNPTIDIFKWTIEDNKIQLLPIEFREQFKNCFYNLDEFYPLRKYKIDNLELFGCNNPNNYLDRYYGYNYMNVAKCFVRNEKGIKDKFKEFNLI